MNRFLKAASDLFFPRLTGSMFVGVPRTEYNYAKDVGTGGNSSVVMVVVNWMMRAFPEAPLIVQERRRGKDWETVPEHPLSQLLSAPNDFYSGEHLWMATVWAWCLFGNAFWRVVRERSRQAREIWWVPPWLIEPVWDQARDGASTKFITHYDYRPGGQTIELDLDQVVHFRHGIDPINQRLGLAPLQSVLREIWSDDEASNWVASLLRNMGIPGLILSPKGEYGISSDEAEALKVYVKGRFTGDHRGEPMSIGAPVDVHKLSFSPSDLDLSVVRDTAEERVSSALGIPAAVVGFGTGLQQTKVGATMGEMRRLAWQNGIVPVQRIMGGEVGRAMLPAFDPRASRLQVAWDYTKVQALQEDERAKAARFNVMVMGGWCKVSEARRALGFETTSDDEIYLRPSSVTPTDPMDQMPEPVHIPLALPNGNGHQLPVNTRNGHTRAQELKQGTLDELLMSIIGRHAVKAPYIPQALEQAVTQVDRVLHGLQPRLVDLVTQGLVRYGTHVGEAVKSMFAVKSTVQDVMDVSRILDQVPMALIAADFTEIYTELYELVAEGTLKAMEVAMEQPLTITPAAQQTIALTAAQRVGLLDLPVQLRDSLLTIIEEARIMGTAEGELAGFIESRVPAGRWSSLEMRARVIARTESRYAGNTSVVELAKSHGFHKVLIFDARLGPTDFVCEERAGWIVSPDEAQVLVNSEHPQGTIGLAILTPTVLADMGVSV